MHPRPRTLDIRWMWAGLLGIAALPACGGGSPRCGDGSELPDSFDLDASGVSVVVSKAPYGITVRDGDGTVVLASADGAGDGFGAVAWTTGSIAYDTYVSPGYHTFFSNLDPWHDRFEVVAATEQTGRLTVVLGDTEDRSAPCVEVVHEVRASTLRITARFLDDGETAPRAWAAGFVTPDDEGFLGFGERFNRTDQRGGDVFSFVEEGGLGTGEGDLAGPDNPFPNGEMMSYYPVPFFVSTRGYGFWLDTYYRSEFNLATRRADGWRGWHVGPTLAYEVYLPLVDDDRPWPYHVIDLFTETTGRPMLPPKWTFGPRRRIGSGSMQGDVPEIQAMRDNDLAITSVDDAVHFYPSGSHIDRTEQLAAWVASAKTLGYRVNGYYNSFVNQDPESKIAPIAAEGAENGYFLKLASGEYPNLWMLTGGDTPQLYLVDFTNPDATAWYQDSFEWALSLGYTGWMYDFGEYVPADALGYDGTSGEALHNQYPVLYAKAIHDALENGPHAGDWLAFMRSGYTGSSAFVPMVWCGDPAASFEDSDGLPSMVRAGVNLNISGAPHWGGDIGGYHCQADGWEAADEELLARWIEQGSMGSNMQDQNACVTSSSALKASIWNATAAMEAWREYARLHTRLFPYLYTLAVDARATGAPVMRHVFLEHPDRTDLRGVDDAYYLGPALYVAPVVERGARQKVVDLPAGRYLDWHDQVLIEGGGQVTLDAPLDKLPLLLRSGYLVPLLDPTIDTLAEEDDAEIIGPEDVAEVYDVVGLLGPSQDATWAVYDGTSLSARRDGAFAAPALPEAATEEELVTCDACYRVDDLGAGLQRVRITTPAGTVTAGGLVLIATSQRKLRWDLYLAP